MASFSVLKHQRITVLECLQKPICHKVRQDQMKICLSFKKLQKALVLASGYNLLRDLVKNDAP